AHFDRHAARQLAPEDGADLRAVLLPVGEQARDLAIGGVQHAVGIDAVRTARPAAGHLCRAQSLPVGRTGAQLVDQRQRQFEHAVAVAVAGRLGTRTVALGTQGMRHGVDVVFEGQG
nr:hypothetical protein [Tanacetum cinerariifolium]